MCACEVQEASGGCETEAVGGEATTACPAACDVDSPRATSELASELDRVGRWALRYGLVLVIGWIGAMKFTAYEAEGISGFVENSPLLGWVYKVVNIRQFSAALGIVELAIAALIVLGSFRPKLGIVGSVGAIGMFATTLSFMFTTPGVVEESAGGFPAISAMPGQFLIKDVVLLAVGIYLLATAVKANTARINE
ncbi:MAG: hypothetical protein DHS20C16_30000 [Phycisphaerae bacterium]|nr:MAG: hypothetical protein DHS20C16_30000 [Phycisphaerae bacterium]